MPPPEPPKDPAADVELLQAVGRVAMESAACDRDLIWLLQGIVGLSSATWILFQGQSSNWLLENISAALKHNPQNARSLNAGDILETINEVKRLYDLRNIVLHGVWYQEPQYSEEEGDDLSWRPQPRPWGEWDSGSRKYYCHRTRIRKVPPDQVLTISDVNRIADEFAANGRRLFSMGEHLISDHSGFPRPADRPG